MEITTSTADRINEVYALSERAASSAIDYAIQIGELLTEAKAGMPHGTWIPWVNENLRFTASQASRYMKLASYKDEIESNRESAHDLSIDSLLKQLTPPKPAPVIPVKKQDIPPQTEVVVTPQAPVVRPQEVSPVVDVPAEVVAAPVTPKMDVIDTDNDMIYVPKAQYDEMAQMVEDSITESKTLAAVLDADDKLAEAVRQIGILTAQIDVLKTRLNSETNKSNELIRKDKSRERLFAKMEKELAAYKVAEVGL
jgi:hypothetical protein